MPQILMLSGRSISTVGLMSAGEDQVAICNPVVYLEATIIGDLTGHTTEWVQMSGTPTVSLIVVDNVRSYYLVPGLPGSDKVFRFYVDRGSVFEQYREITIRTTPASIARWGENGGTIGLKTEPSYSFVQSFRSAILAPFDYTIPFNSLGTFVSGTAILSYGLPELYYQTADNNTQSYSSRFVNTVVDKWNGSSWVNYHTASLSQTREVLVNDNERIRIGATYSTPNGNVTNYSQWYDFSSGALFGAESLRMLENGGVQGTTTITRNVFVLLAQTYSENIPMLENGMAQSVPVITRIVYTLVPLDYSENITHLENGGAAGKFTITRTSGGSIGG